MTKRVLAADLGATSGRAILFTEHNGRIAGEEEIRRFRVADKAVDGHPVWDAEFLFGEILAAIHIALEKYGRLDGVGVDTWGADFGLISSGGALSELPRRYRDPVNAATRRALAARSYEFFKISGISDNDFNTTYQLIARKNEGFDFGKVESLLFMPCLMAYMLTGVKATEPTIASTSGFYTAEKGFDRGFLEKYGIPRSIFPEKIETGGMFGCIADELMPKDTTYAPVPVFAVSGHDTACAFHAVAAEQKSSDAPLVLSSGTWSLFGTFIDKPLTTRDAFDGGYTNELAADGRTRFMKNIMGMWLIEECLKQWVREGRRYSYGEIAALAANAKTEDVFIDVNDGMFYEGGQMADKVKNYLCRVYGVKCRTDGEVAAYVYRSMAKAYKNAYDDLCALTGQRYKTLHVVGGGARNGYLNELTRSTIGIDVIAGAAEASALGNALQQFEALKKRIGK